MSIAHVDSIYIQSEKIFCPLSRDEMESLKQLGLLDSKNMRIYQMEYLARILEVHCPIIEQSGGGFRLVLSCEKRPYRRYPSHVYLYAALLYILGLSMREAARRVRRLFSLTRFSHSTISRLFKHLAIFTDELEDYALKNPPATEAVNQLPEPGKGSVSLATADVKGQAGFFLPGSRASQSRSRLMAALYKLLIASLARPAQASCIILPLWQLYGVMIL